MIYNFLNTNGILYSRVDHPPVATCEDARRLLPPMEGSETKNLFLRDPKGRRHFLVSISSRHRVDLDALSDLLGAGRLGFASAERLKKHLGVEPGAVTLLAAINDTEQKVEIIVDESLWQSSSLQCHPLVNTSTLVIKTTEVARFLELTKHRPRILRVPGS